MNTIKIFLAESGRIADLKKDFPLYQGQFNDKLLNVYVPTSILAPHFEIQHYIGQIQQAVAPTNEELDLFVRDNTYPMRAAQKGDIVEFYDTDSEPSNYIYTNQGDGVWTRQTVDSFGTFENLSGTSIKIGCLATKRDGSIYKSKAYYMRYLKTLTYQNVEYALYERKLPKEFTYFAGQGENAQTLVLNVVNVDTEQGKVLSLVTSQTCSLDVMRSDILDEDETVEPSEFDELYAIVNSMADEIALKQNRVDDTLSTLNKTIAGAINEVYTYAQRNRDGIVDNSEKIAQNTNDIDYLYTHLTQPEEYIGQMTGSSLPTDAQLDAYVLSVADREPKNADVVIFILQIEGETDKNYKYIYSIDSWNGYEIPPLEEAANGSLGLIEGTYSVGSTNGTLVDISGGQILNIYVKNASSEYVNIRQYLNSHEQSITNIINGTTTVKKADVANKDSSNRNIVDTYMTKSQGATKQDLYDYALPKTFSNVLFVGSQNNFVDEVPTYSQPVSLYSINTSSVGTHSFFYVEKTISGSSFQLSNKNSYNTDLYVQCSYYGSATFSYSVVLRVITRIYKNNQWVLLNSEIVPVEFTRIYDGIRKVQFRSTFASLTDIITVEEGDIIRQTFEIDTYTSDSLEFSVLSNTTYPSIFNFTTVVQSIALPTASKTQKGGIWAWEDEHGIHISLTDPMEIQVQTSTSAGGTNYTITTQNYTSENNAAGGQTITIGDTQNLIIGEGE